MHHKKLFSLDSDMWAEVSGVTLCVCMCVWLWNVDECVLVYMWRSDKSSPSWVLPQDSFSLVFLRQRLSFIVIIHLGILETKTLTVTWGSLIQLGWLVLEPQGSTCLNQLSTWITVLSPLARLFNVYLREQTQVPLLTRQALHLLK